MNTIRTTNIEDYTNQALAIFKIVVESSHKPIHIALSGGTSPIPLYQALSNQPIDWSQIHLWWADERYVPPDDEQSNYYQAKITFVNKINIPPQNIHPYDTSINPQSSAQNYLAQIQNYLGSTPSFDLTILGIGEDGHTASLFPHTPEGQNQITDLIIPIYKSPKPPPTRLTFTFPLINQSKNILILIKGQPKVDLYNQWQSNIQLDLPFTHIKSLNGNTYWLLFPNHSI